MTWWEEKYNRSNNAEAFPEPGIDFNFENEYNIRNWRSDIVHAAKPIWKTWKEIPEEEKRSGYGNRPFKVDYYISLCGVTDSPGYTFHYAGRLRTYTLCKHNVTCKRCLAIMNGTK